MRALFDNDVLLDYFLERPPFADDAEKLLLAHEQGLFKGYVSAITPLNLYYIARKLQGDGPARTAVATIINTFEICPITLAELQVAVSHPIRDIEDAVQHTTAVTYNLDAIITRNHKDFKNATIPVYSPADFLAKIGFVSL